MRSNSRRCGRLQSRLLARPCDIAAGNSADIDVNGVPDSCEYARGDFDLDGAVAGADLSILLGNWGPTGL